MDADFIYPRYYVQPHIAFHIIYYTLVPAISFFGNLFTFIIVCKISKYRKSVQDSLVGALALNDVLTAIIVMLPSLIAELWGRYFGSKVFCEFSAVTVVWYVYTTFAIIVLISVERWIAISKPFLYKRLAITPTFMKGVVGCLGCFCLLLASIPLFIHPVMLKSGWYCSMVTFKITNITFNDTTALEVTEVPVNEVLFIKIAFLTVGITMLLSCNISIAYQLTRKKSFDLRSNRLERKFAKLMWVVAICFLLTWLPNLFARFACAQGSAKCEVVQFYAMKVVMAGCAVNPLVYGVMKKTYRRGYIYLTRMTLHYSTFTIIPAPKYGEEIFDLREGTRINAGSSSGTRASTSVSAP